VDEETAHEIVKTFIEAIAAPGYDPAALEIFSTKKNMRAVVVEPVADGLVVKSINGGFLAQTPDNSVLDRSSARSVTERQPTQEEWRGLEFAWKVVKHVKSNAIVYAREGQLLSAGAGQMSRVFSVEIGAKKSVLPLEGCVLASDAFFPFPDGLEAAARHGVTAVIQPGGSVKDIEVIEAANRLGVAMVLTGVRLFRH
jgi:phosphoribosylaminoimidazolecarboxamide formyltransferase/IMP cyclohydrolase